MNKDLQTRVCLHLQLFTVDSKPAALEIIIMKLLYFMLFHLVRASVVKIVLIVSVLSADLDSRHINRCFLPHNIVIKLKIIVRQMLVSLAVS